MKLTPDIRGTFRKLLKKGLTVTRIAQLFDTTRQTVYRWVKRAKHVGREYFNDRPRKPKESKITVEVEVSILELRNSLSWGTARIQQGLYKLPEFMKESMPCVVQGVWLSRSAINNVLKKHGINGYPRKHSSWKFFRAKETDELWQIDIKGPYRVQGRKYWFLVCIDDYSRFLVLAEQFSHDLKTNDITALLEKMDKLPKSILSDHGSQFKEKWERWCKEHGIEPLFAHPYYPQDKGKVERTIQNLNREFIYQLRRFPGWLDGGVDEYQEWYNNSRFHRGINAMPAELYGCNVGNFT